MPIKPTEMERIILADGWIFKNQTGSHRHYIHPSKPGKVTIPFHKGKELNKSLKILSVSKRESNNHKEVYSSCYQYIRHVFLRKIMDTL